MADKINNLKVFSSSDDLNSSVVEFIISIANKCVLEKGRFSIVLSGGHTPESLYVMLARFDNQQQMPWGKTFVFWGDERCVPLTDDRNNAYKAKQLLLDKVDIPKANIYRIPVDLSPGKAAEEYEKKLMMFFGNEKPEFDLILLGLGENGHTASLFPATPVIDKTREGISEVYVEEEKMYRITMTAPLINRAHTIFFLVSGDTKSEVLKHVLNDAYGPDRIPAQLIKPVNGELYWFADKSAASLITNS